MRVRLAVLGTVLLAAGCGGSGTKTTPKPPPPPPPPPPTTATTGGARATLLAPTHSPKINAKWRYAVRLTDRRRRPLAGKITVQIVDPLGTAHAVQYDETKQNIVNRPFKGVFRDYAQFPPDARGFRLTFRVRVRTAKGRVQITYPVTPR